MYAEIDEKPLLPNVQNKKSTFSRIKTRLRITNLKCIQYLVLTLGIYLLIIISIFLQDLPRFGGPNQTCKRFHYSAPESSKSNATYPFPNTFNIGKKLDFSGANTPTAWQNTQTLGYHNSYHKRNQPGDLTYWASFWMILTSATPLQYTHPTLEQQLSGGFRTFELDFHLKPDGIMNYHEQMWDQNTHCYCLSECLQTFYRFSKENPNHSPITIILEPKNVAITEDSYPVFQEISLENILSMEQELLNVIGSEKLITPDSIRLENKSLGESVKSRGWPSVYDLEGLFLFILWDQGHRGLSREMYEPGTDHLKGRLIFTSQYLKDFDSDNLNDHVFLHADNPLDNQELARVAIKSNHMLRTRGTEITEDFEEDAEGLEKIRELGQQVVSGDQYLEEAWAEIVKDCTEFEDLDGKVCVRK